MKTWIGATAVLMVVALAGPRFVPQAPADHVGAPGADEFSGLHELSVQLDADARVGNGSTRTNQHRRGAKNSRRGRVAGGSRAIFAAGREFPGSRQRIARGAGNGFLVGVVDWKPLPGGGIGATNSAALLDSSGALNFLYDKIHLVPFSEYVPWRKWLSFAEDLTGLIGDFQHGTQYKVGQIAGGPFSVFICYEAIFPNEVRRFTLAGAALFVNISDDGWFGGSGAPAAASGDGARARRGKSTVAVARYQRRNHGFGGSLRAHRCATAGRYSRRAGCAVRFSHGPDALCALGRLDCVAVRDRRAHVTVARRARSVACSRAPQIHNSTGHTWTSKICSDARTNFRSESNSCGAIFDVARSREIIASLEAKTSQPDFWQDQEQAQKILQQRKVAEGVVASDEKLARTLSDIETYFNLAHEETDVAQRDSLLHDIEREIASADTYVSELETLTLLSGENDGLNAIMTIKPGAGRHGVAGLGGDAAAHVSALGGAQRVSRNRHGSDARRRRGTQIRHGARRRRERLWISLD